MIRFLKEAGGLKGKRVLVRIDVNVPIFGNAIKDDFRIRRVLPTLRFLKEHGAFPIVISHHSHTGQTLEPVAEYLGRIMKTRFIRDFLGTGVTPSPEEDAVYVCENLRFFKEEEANDEAFSKKLASLGELYVNDAFAVSHRHHASIVTLPKFLPSYAGLLFEDEIKNLSVAFTPPRPSLFILGGAKAKTKLPLAEKFSAIADTVFLGGALANNCFKDQGYEIGISAFEDMVCNLASSVEKGTVILPSDVVVRDGAGRVVKNPADVLPEEKIVDAGPQTLQTLKAHIKEAAFILWNGPLGDLEEGFSGGTIELLNAIADANARTLIGGGDTVSVVSGLGKEERFGFISTGGGAMLEFLLHRTLPGIQALERSQECFDDAQHRSGTVN